MEKRYGICPQIVLNLLKKLNHGKLLFSRCERARHYQFHYSSVWELKWHLIIEGGWCTVKMVDACIRLSELETWLWHEQTVCSYAKSPLVPLFIICKMGIWQDLPYRIVKRITRKHIERYLVHNNPWILLLSVHVQSNIWRHPILWGADNFIRCLGLVLREW